METIRVKGVDIPVDVYQKMLDEGLEVLKHDTIGSSPAVQTPHGLFQNQNVGGLFTRPGAEPEIYSAFVMPTGGQILADLYNGVSDIETPEYDIITGVKDGTGSNAANFCSPGPKAGFAKLCTQRNVFGEFKMDFDQVNLMKTGARINRADVDYRVVNQPGLFPLMPDVLSRAGNPNTTLGLQLMRMAVHLSRILPNVIYHGNKTNTGSNAQLGFIKEFDGFDALIKTGYTDLDSGVPCPRADSLIVNWNNTDVAGSVNGATIIDTIAGILYYLMNLADDSGLAPVSWILSMHTDLFWRLTALWPCSYLTNQCSVSTSAGQQLNVSGAEQVQMRDEMRSGKFLWVNGMRVPVRVSTAIEQTTLGQGFSSPIYFIPLTALGARVTYLEGFNLNNDDIQEYQAFYANLPIRTMNNGLFMMGSRVTDACVEGWIASKLRMVMRTPWLAARIDNVNYSLPGKFYTSDPNPSGAYHKDGGQYYRTPPVYN